MQTDTNPYSPPQTQGATSCPQLPRTSRTFSVLAPTIVFLVLQFAGGMAGSYAYRHDVFWTSTESHDNPPWYFLGQDLVSAISYSIALSILFTFVFFTRVRYQTTYRWLLPMALLWMGYPIAEGIIVLIRTDNIMDPTVASSHWQSQAAYLSDPLRNWAFAITVATTLAAGLAFRPWIYRPQTGNGDKTGNGDRSS